jgi:HEAT repeat protein
MATEEALESLGECGGAEAVEILSGFLRDPRAILRRAAAKGLGQTGSPAAIDPLIESASVAGDPDLRRASLQALRALEAEGVAGVFGDALWDQHPSVRAAAAEGISELQITQLAPSLRESVTWFGDETASEMAYALGVVGSKGDLPAILATADAAVSKPLRLRCLMGAARILGHEREFYRLISLEGMTRDQELLRILRPGIKANPEWAEALDRYSSDDPHTAAAMILKTLQIPEAELLSGSSSAEVFILAVLLAGESMEGG